MTSDFSAHSNRYGMPPCRSCTERTITCHGKCERYSKYVDKIHELKHAEKMKKASGNFHEDFYWDIHKGGNNQ